MVSTAPPKSPMIRHEPEPDNISRHWEEEEAPRGGISAWTEKFNPSMVLENSGSVGE